MMEEGGREEGGRRRRRMVTRGRIEMEVGGVLYSINASGRVCPPCSSRGSGRGGCEVAGFTPTTLY